MVLLSVDIRHHLCDIELCAFVFPVNGLAICFLVLRIRLGVDIIAVAKILKIKDMAANKKLAIRQV